ncbi:hypothetical protein KI387_014241, partial [Taxus chinensis]
MEDPNRSVQPKQRTFVLGHPGQKYAEDAKSQESREKMESHHMYLLQRGTRKHESAEVGYFHLGQSGQKYVQDAGNAKTLKWPKAKKKSQ